MIVFLVGYMGCGKSSMGRRIAKDTGFPLIDMDRDIEQQQNQTVAEIFASRGETAFRQIERDWLLNLKTAENMIVATGGGAPCQGNNMAIMNEKGITIYLKMSAQKIAGRLSATGRAKRPLIKDLDDEQLLEFMNRNMPERDQFYSQARMIVDCDSLSDEHVCEHIENYIKMCVNSKV